MIEYCFKCGTSYKVDESKIIGSIKLFKCSICNYEWSINDNFIFEKKNDKLNKNDGVKKELEAIRSEIKKNTDKIEENNKKKKNDIEPKDIKNKNANKVHNVKNKSVIEIASEIAESNVKKDFSENINKSSRKLGLKKSDQISKVNNVVTSSFKIPVLMLFLISILSTSLYFRSTIIGVSYAYFPNYTDIYFPKIHQLFEKIKVPFNAELDKMEISNFGATYEKNAIKFFGNIKNNSVFPIVSPSIKAIVVTEDGKILAETLIPLNKKYISSKNALSFSYLFKTNKSFQNTTVRATLLTEIQINS